MQRPTKRRTPALFCRRTTKGPLWPSAAALISSTGAVTPQQAIDRAVGEFARRGINCIVYRDGRRVDAAAYAEMAIRTAATRGRIQGAAQQEQRELVAEHGDILRRDYWREKGRLDSGVTEKAEASRELFEDVLEEYLSTAMPGTDSITYDEGYNIGGHTAEIKTAQWLHDNLGGDIVLLNERNEDKVKTPDYIWRGKRWDLKSVSTEKAANSAVRHGLSKYKKIPEA